MKYSVGLQKCNYNFVDNIIKNKEHIHEVYFSWGDFPSGRSSQTLSENHTPWEMIDIQKQFLKSLSDENISLNLLLNANCYGKDSQSRAFFNKIGDTIDYINSNYGLSSITTTSPLIAKFVKNNFDSIEVRASVNMEIGTIEGMEYISEYFDGYYMKRELNRDFNAIEHLHNWCMQNSKKLYMLANSGCLNFCSAHNFHDNLVAHENEISEMNNAYNFTGVCSEFLKNENNLKKLYNYTNFVRPEDMSKYDRYFTAAKLATRVHNTAELVLDTYIKGKYSGDILRLLEPAHSIYPYVLENGEPPIIKRIDK